MLIREKDKLLLQCLAKQNIRTSCEILAYGSRVDGSAHDTSDLDLVIKCDSGKVLDISEFMSFKDGIQESNIPILVQVLDWNRIPNNFRCNILNNYEVLFSNS